MKTVRRVRRAALAAGSEGHLVMLTMPLPGDLHSTADYRHAREEVKRVVNGWPAWYVVEEGHRRGELHAHIITVTDAVPGALVAFPDIHGEPVWKLATLAEYLSKPGEGAAARTEFNREISIEAVRRAAQRYCAARAVVALEGRQRLAARSGTVNTPNRRKALPPQAVPLHVLAAGVSLALVLLASAMADRDQHRQSCAALLERLRTARRSAPGRSHHTPRRTRLPGVSVRFLAPSRRPLLVGHARPPPRREAAPRSKVPGVRGLL